MALVVTDVVQGQDVTRVSVSPSVVQLGVGERTQVMATAYGANGAVVSSAAFSWSSPRISVATVSFDNSMTLIGNIEGKAVGLVSIEVRAGGAVGILTVQVGGGGEAPPQQQQGITPPAQVGTGVARELRIEPQELLLLPGETAQLSARFFTGDGSLAATQRVEWVSRQLMIADVEDSGLVMGLAEGSAIVMAISDGGLSGRVFVEVQRTPIEFRGGDMALGPGSIDTAVVVVPGQSNRIVNPRSLNWTSTNPAVARVSPLGIVSSVTGGKTQIVARGFRQEIRMSVAVHRLVTGLSARPGFSRPVNVPIEGGVTFDVIAEDSNGVVVDEAILEWVIGDTTIIEFDLATTSVRGRRLGETTLSVRAPGRGRLEVEWQIHVIEGGVSLSAERAGLGVRDQVAVEASFTDRAGNVLGPATGIVWSSSDETVATVSRFGNIEGISFGKAYVTASTSSGSVDSMVIFVQGEILVSSNRTGTLDVFAFNRDTPWEMVQVTFDPGHVTSASLSPDGTRLVYVSNSTGTNDIYVADADGSNVTMVAGSEFNEDAPEWSADGSRIAYQSNRGGYPQIWVMGANGSNQTQLTTEGANTLPAFSNEGLIAFTSTRDGNYEIYLMGADGSNQRNITNSPNRETNPVWMSNGQVAFLVAGGLGRTMQVVRQDAVAMGGQTFISPPGLTVTDFAVSRSGDLMAMIVSELTDAGQTNKLFLHMLNTASTASEVRRNDPNERFFGVSFRR